MIQPHTASPMQTYCHLLRSRDILEQMIQGREDWLNSVHPTSTEIAMIQDSENRKAQMIKDLEWCERLISEIETCGCVGVDLPAQELRIPQT